MCISCVFSLDQFLLSVYYVCIAKGWSSREIIKALEAEGWELVATKGDHHQLRHPEKPGRVTVTHPRKDIPIGTLKSIYTQAGWDWADRE